MKITLDINCNGKNYSTLNRDLEYGIRDEIKLVLKKIEPFENEMKKHNGEITVNANGNPLTITISENGLPKELSEEIRKAIM